MRLFQHADPYLQTVQRFAENSGLLLCIGHGGIILR
jgi:hypothetical protein